MTIVDSINKITESLGGDTTGAHTAEKAIDALGPVIGGGGASMGSAVVVYDEDGNLITIELNNLTSFDDYTAIEKPNFTEPTLVIDNDPRFSSTKKIGEHGFDYLYVAESHAGYTLEWVTYDEIDVEYDPENDRFTGGSGFRTYARAYKNGAWGDWQPVG